MRRVSRSLHERISALENEVFGPDPEGSEPEQPAQPSRAPKPPAGNTVVVAQGSNITGTKGVTLGEHPFETPTDQPIPEDATEGQRAQIEAANTAGRDFCGKCGYHKTHKVHVG